MLQMILRDGVFTFLAILLIKNSHLYKLLILLSSWLRNQIEEFVTQLPTKIFLILWIWIEYIGSVDILMGMSKE